MYGFERTIGEINFL